MSYQVRVDYAPVSELISSLDLFILGPSKGMDLGPEWIEEMVAALGPAATTLAWASPYDPFLLALLVEQCPGDRTAATFLAWLESLTPGQLYELLAPFVPADATELLRDLGQLQSRFLRLLKTWTEFYASRLDPSLLERLAADANYRREQIAIRTPVDVVDRATVGLMVESEALDRVLLVPQHHWRPLNRYTKCGKVLVVFYPVEAPHGGPGQPDPSLMRLTRALGDENRMRILHFLAEEQPKSFTDVLKHIGLAKNTVHYHLSALRSAGLVRIHLTGECGSERYTARRCILDELGPRLQRFLDER